MTSFFSAQERDATLRALTQFAGRTSDILGVLLVGSGATAFTDAYSDLDIVYVADTDAFSTVLGEVQRFVTTELRPVFQTTYQHRDDVVVICMLLDSYLEVDIGIWAEASLFASSPRWRVLWQRDERTGASVVGAMRNHPRLDRPYEPIVTGDHPLWQAIYGRYTARQRRDQAQTQAHQQALASLLAREPSGHRSLESAASACYDEARLRALAPLLAG